MILLWAELRFGGLLKPAPHGSAPLTNSIPAMAAECELVFSSAGKMITSGRNRLGNDIVEG